MISIVTIISFLGIAGFSLARYIHKKKSEKKPLICPMRTSCAEVVTSDYSKMFGVPLEVFGMWYYGVLGVVYGFLAIFPGVHSTFISFLLVLASLVAFVVSIYLICVQAFALRAWCTWCLMSAFISTIIFALSLIAHDTDFISILKEYKVFVVILHAVAATVGVGGATVTDIFFFRFLSDRKISVFEADVLNILSKVIWGALGLLVVTGIGLFLSSETNLLVSSKFVTKMVGVLILIANGVALNLIVSPRLMHISFGESHRHIQGELVRLRRVAFALGAISISSWYMIFILGSVKSVPLATTTLLSLYIGMILVSVLISQLMDRHFSSQSQSSIS
ncbi:MAG: hypothetical protein QG669_121 [Patescibacteria group bacterium]|nr:hypothetical protein [Patescibacteria group bacterium]